MGVKALWFAKGNFGVPGGMARVFSADTATGLRHRKRCAPVK
jgi:hypothetical protein